MKVTPSIDEQILKRSRERALAMGKHSSQGVQGPLMTLASDDVERDLEEFVRLSGLGDSNGWKFNREEIYDLK